MWDLRRTTETKEPAVRSTVVAPPSVEDVADQYDVSDRILNLKVLIHKQLLDRINLSLLDKMPREQIATDVADIVAEMLESNGEVLNRAERTALSHDVL